MKKRKQAAPPAASSSVPVALLGDIRDLILDTRSTIATTVNAGLTLLYWKIGHRIAVWMSEMWQACKQRSPSIR